MQVPQNSLSAPSHLQNDILIWGSIHQLHGHSCFLFASEFHVNLPDVISETKSKCCSINVQVDIATASAWIQAIASYSQTIEYINMQNH